MKQSEPLAVFKQESSVQNSPTRIHLESVFNNPSYLIKDTHVSSPVKQSTDIATSPIRFLTRENSVESNKNKSKSSVRVTSSTQKRKDGDVVSVGSGSKGLQKTVQNLLAQKEISLLA